MKKTKELNGTLHQWKGQRGGNGKYTIPQIFNICIEQYDFNNFNGIKYNNIRKINERKYLIYGKI